MRCLIQKRDNFLSESFAGVVILGVIPILSLPDICPE